MDQQKLIAYVVAEIDKAFLVSDLRKGFELARLALSKGLSHYKFFYANAVWAQACNRPYDAVNDFQNAVSLAPKDPELLQAFGLCLLQTDRVREAADAFLSAASLSATARRYYLLGYALALQGEHASASAAYRRALSIQPDHADALANLASIEARKGGADNARRLADIALAIQPDNPTAHVALATLDLAEKKFLAADARLKPLLHSNGLEPQQRAAIWGFLGDSLDGQQQYAEAFAAYSAGNLELRQRYTASFSKSRGIDALCNLIGYFQHFKTQRSNYSDYAPIKGPAQHVFLLGFMRSGTTLLEQVLSASKNVIALEEKGLLQRPEGQFFTSVPALDSFFSLGENDLRTLREGYWNRVYHYDIDVKDKVFIDKQPLNTIKLPLIARLFPQAKIIFAVRDPRDVVFSCFRRHLKTNATMFEFLDLQDAARFYACTMDLGEIYREKFSLNLVQYCYENTVNNFKANIRNICSFIEADWEESMRDFHKSTPAVDIRSPSAMQVRRPLYNEGIGQWRNYRDQLTSILPILRPWVEKFGYTDD